MAHQVLVIGRQKVCVCCCELCGQVWVAAWRGANLNLSPIPQDCLPQQCAKCKSRKWDSSSSGVILEAGRGGLREDDIGEATSSSVHAPVDIQDAARKLAKSAVYTELVRMGNFEDASPSRPAPDGQAVRETVYEKVED